MVTLPIQCALRLFNYGQFSSDIHRAELCNGKNFNHLIISTIFQLETGVERSNYSVERSDYNVERSNYCVEQSDLKQSDHGAK